MSDPAPPFTRDVVVIGGAGHVGLPLAVALASTGLTVTIQDLDPRAVETVLRGQLPFLEEGVVEPMRAALADGTLTATTDPDAVGQAEAVVVVIGTPVDEHLNPDPRAVARALLDGDSRLRDGQLVILRSTVYPGVTAQVERRLAQAGIEVDVAFCPERIAEGKAMTELHSLPQLVGARTPAVRERAAAFFRRLTPAIVEVEPEEAELAKLFTNTWRYIKFAAANQFFLMANDHGLDFERIRAAITADYPRAADMPGAGFAAGPCLTKDVMQLAAFSNNAFALGHSAMLVNEGLPLYLVSRLEQDHPLAELTVGILGMAFKAESDDIRSSLSYKVKRILAFKAARVLTSDPYVTVDADLVPEDELLAQCDIVIIGAPHAAYRDVRDRLPAGATLVDVWNLTGQGSRV